VGDDGVEDIGIEVSTVIPENCADFRVDLDGGKVSGILQGGKDTGEGNDFSEVNGACDAVFKLELKLMIGQGLDVGDVFEHGVILIAGFAISETQAFAIQKSRDRHF
jgi:hypothetical protein